jgi:hypothetical protein
MLHRDINKATVMINRDGKGILIDWDFTIYLDDSAATPLQKKRKVKLLVLVLSYPLNWFKEHSASCLSASYKTPAKSTSWATTLLPSLLPCLAFREVPRRSRTDQTPV